MKNKLFFTLTSILPLVLTGCGGASNDFNIEFSYFTPTAYVNEEYDFSEALVVEDGVNYHLDVYYFDYYQKVEKTLEVKNTFYFTPTELFEISVVVTATKGNDVASRIKTIPVSQRVDPIDELISSGGFSGWADAGFTKEIVTDEAFIKGENSHSAISVHFQGSHPYIWGATVLAINNFRLIPHWTDQSWENAVLRFWVYNPTEYTLEFQLRVCDEYTKLVNVDWGNPLIVPQFAEPGEWTEILFSLKKIGVNHTLFVNEEGTRNDSLSVKVRYGGTPASDDELYSYQFYVDDVDVVPYSKERFPDMDTNCYATAETIEYGWENLKLDTGWNRSVVLYDRELVNSTSEHESLSSVYLTFASIVPDDHNGYALIYSIQEEFDAEHLPSFRHGTLDFDIQFSNNIANKDVIIFAVHETWTVAGRLTATPTTTSNDWLHVSIDFGEHSDFYNVTRGIRLGFSFPGINDGNKATANIHIDNLFFEQYAGIPEDQIEVEVIRGIPFTPGYSIDLNPVSLTETMIIDFKFTSGEDTKITFMVGDRWTNYYGNYVLQYDGTLEGAYSGVSVQTLEDGYYRVSLNLSELDYGQAIEGIHKIDLLYMRADENSASGYIDFINPTVL